MVRYIRFWPDHYFSKIPFLQKQVMKVPVQFLNPLGPLYKKDMKIPVRQCTSVIKACICIVKCLKEGCTLPLQ